MKIHCTEELTYLDLLVRLESEIENEVMGDTEKDEILSLISALAQKLWKYSA